MKSTTSFVAALVVTVGLAAPSAAVEWQGRGYARGHAKADKPASKQDKQIAKSARKQDKQVAKSTRKADKDVGVFDRDGHARVIRDYRRAGLPPGLAKRDSLPPGLRRQLHERGELPPGLQKRLVGVPYPLESRLPRVPSYYQRYFAGDDLVVVDTRTNRIAAIVRDVLR
jgi:hypothetical protein